MVEEENWGEGEGEEGEEEEEEALDQKKAEEEAVNPRIQQDSRRSTEVRAANHKEEQEDLC